MSDDQVPENLKQRLKDSYDAIATEYNAWAVPHSGLRLQYLDKLLAMIDSDSTSPKSVLELGCGCGIPVTRNLLSRGDFQVTANDLSSAQIKVTRENLVEYKDNLNLIEGDMTLLKFDEESFDMVVGMYSLIHLPRAEQEETIQKIARWLKPGGYLLANFSKEAMEGAVQERWLADKGWMYWSGFGTEKTKAKISEAGLEVVMAEVSKDVVDSSFLWVIARKTGEL